MSVILLASYSIVVLHNVIPHVHNSSHEHDIEVAALQDSHHGHSHHHSHESNSNWFDFLLGLLGDMDHSDIGENHFEDFTLQNNNNFDFTQFNTGEVALVASIARLEYSISNQKKGDYFIRPPILCQQFNGCSEPPRGPPSIS